MPSSVFTSGSLTLAAAFASAFSPHAGAADWNWATGDYLAQSLPNPVVAALAMAVSTPKSSLARLSRTEAPAGKPATTRFCMAAAPR